MAINTDVFQRVKLEREGRSAAIREDLASGIITETRKIKMTPAVQIVKKARLAHKLHEYNHDPSVDSYGREAAAKLGLEPNRVFKTLVVSTDGQNLAVAVLPVSSELDLKTFAKVAGAKKADLAEKKSVERTTGYVLGGVSPVGMKKTLKTIIDSSARDFDTIYVSAGRRGLQIELKPDDLQLLTRGKFEVIVRQ